VNIPGTGASMATTLDGPAMTRKGQSRKALEIALVASAVGDFLSSFGTILVIGLIAMIALMIGPPEISAILLLSLLIIVVSSTGSFLKGMVMLLIGMFLATIGQDPVGAMARFDFGFYPLQAGIDLLPLIIGLFAIPEILFAIEHRRASVVDPSHTKAQGEPLRWHELMTCRRTILRSTAIGGFIGMVPGVGQVVAAFMGYSAAQSASSHPETFGKGDIEGVAAPEAANNAVNGPTMVPLLTLGIPGSAATAIMLAAMMLQGVNPGPLLFIMDPSMVYTIFAAMIIANVLMIGAGVGVAQMFSTLMRTPPAILAGFIVILSLIGAYGVRNNIFDVYVCLVFGVIGWAMKRVGFPSAPLVLGVILGPLAERYFLTSIANSRQDYTVFFTRPISATILSLALIFVLWSLWPSVRTRIGRQPAQAKPKER